MLSSKRFVRLQAADFHLWGEMVCPAGHLTSGLWAEPDWEADCSETGRYKIF